jgi:hypothetical protein
MRHATALAWSAVTAGIVVAVSIAVATTAMLSAHNACVLYDRPQFLPQGVVASLDSDSDGLLTMKDSAAVLAQILVVVSADTLGGTAEWRHRVRRSAASGQDKWHAAKLSD